MTWHRVFPLGILLAATSCVSPQPVDYTLDEAGRQKFMEHAMRWQVSQPSGEAVLHKILCHWNSERPQFLLGFMEPGETNILLVGASIVTLDWSTRTEVVTDSRHISLEDVLPTSPFFPSIEYNVGLATGVQLIRRGDSQTGWALIDKALKVDAGHGHSPLFSRAEEDPTLRLARACLAAAVNDLLLPKPDYANIKVRVKKLVRDQRKLKSETTDYLLKGLEANLRHQPGTPGSIRAVVDGYVMAGGLVGEERDFTPGARTLILAGFDAVPELIEQRRSLRFSNHLMQGFNNFPTYPMNARQAIDRYLSDLANDDLGLDWLAFRKGYDVEKRELNDWWRFASKLGEREYARRFTVNADRDGKGILSEVLLTIVVARHQSLVPELYESALRLKMSSSRLAEALTQSADVSPERKVELLLAGVATSQDDHRNSALSRLIEVSPAVGEQELVRLLRLAAGTSKREVWSDQDAGLSYLVSRSHNPEAWKALSELLARADARMCLEIIGGLELLPDSSPLVVRSLYEFFSRYKDDPRVYDESVNGDAFRVPYDRVVVGDYIHVHCARQLGLKHPQPQQDAPTNEWLDYRKSVGPEIERRFAEHLSKDQPLRRGSP